MATKTKKATVNAFEKALNKNATKEKPKSASKSTAPVIKLPGDLGKQMDDFQSYKKAKKDAEANMRLAEKSILAYCQEIQDTEAIKGKFAGSYELSGNASNGKLVTVDSFKMAQDEDTLVALKRVLGKNFGKAVEKGHKVTLKAEVMESAELQNKLMEKVGEAFAEFFDVTEVWQPVKGLNQAIYEICGFKQNKIDEVRSLLIQKKASIR